MLEADILITVDQYCELYDLDVNRVAFGRLATAAHVGVYGEPPDRLYDEQFGTVHAYPAHILVETFHQHYRNIDKNFLTIRL